MIKRREFLKGAGCALLTTSLITRKSSAAMEAPHDSDVLKGFIVSDAHFGWSGKDQPTPEIQREMIGRIHKRFPDLDIWIDTGDAHHGSLGEEKLYEATRNWTDIIANQSNGALFYYVPGNHEICGPTEGKDSERRCARMGSMSYRPYYSFDVKGIHFVSVPELEHPVYVNKETMNWLELDLALNRDKTTILFSHNNIKETTGDDSYMVGYRGVSNSEAVLDVMTRYPNVIGWMHGHNHDYVICKRQGRLFVSNGRIGGFNYRRTFSDGEPLGGIYFEITPKRFTVQSYSAEDQKFLDEDMGRAGRSQTLNTATTVKASAPVNYAFGHGGFLDGQRAAIYNYHTSKDAQCTLVLAGTDDACINGNTRFTNYTHRSDFITRQQWTVFGYQVGKEGWPQYFEKENDVWQWLDPGVLLLAREKAEQVTYLRIPAPSHKETMYYRAVAGKDYLCELTLSTPEGGQTVEFVAQAYSQEGEKLWETTLPKQSVTPGEHVYSFSIQVPQLNGEKTIYDDPMLDTEIQLAFEARFTSLLTPLEIKQATFRRADSGGTTETPTLIFNGGTVKTEEALEDGTHVVTSLPKPQEARWTVEGHCGGSRRMLWYCRQTNIDWQVRNAPVADHGSFLMIEKPTSPWSSDGEVIIIPASSNQDAVYVHRLKHMESAKIWPLNRGNTQVAVEMLSGTGTGAAEVIAPQAPTEVKGAKSWSYEKGIVRIHLEMGDRATIWVGKNEAKRD